MKRGLVFLAIVGIVCLMLVQGVYAAVWYVSTSGSDSNGGQSWDDAFRTIQHAINSTAIDSTQAADEIWVQAGQYNESVLIFSRFAGIYGGFSGTETSRSERDWIQNETIVDGNGKPVFKICSASDVILDGLTVTGGAGNSGPQGGGIHLSNAKLTVIHCKVTGNSAKYGGGIFAEWSIVDIIDSLIYDNSAMEGGGGIYVLGGFSTFSFRMINSIVWGNSAHTTDNNATGGGIYFNFNVLSSTVDPIVTNCVVFGNSSDKGGGIYNLGYNIPQITNSVIWANSAQEFDQIGYDSDDHRPTVTYSDVQGGYSGLGNIDEDPLFINPDQGDFHLSSNSPCIDKGTNNATGIPLQDFEGDTRIIDGDQNGTPTVDMGADEYLSISVVAVPALTPGGILILALLLGLLIMGKLRKTSVTRT